MSTMIDVTPKQRKQWATERKHGATLCATGHAIAECRTFSERLGWFDQLAEESDFETRRYLEGGDRDEPGFCESQPSIQ